MRNIITHDGQFHADEIFAIALIHSCVEEMPVKRTRIISTEDIDNPEIWILDVGMKYQPERYNFDHHQNKDLGATNMLILKYLYITGYIKEDLYSELLPKFIEISEIDKSGYDGYTGFQVNNLIKSMNNLSNGWEVALEIARNYITSCKLSVHRTKESLDIWNGGKVIGCVRQCNVFPIHWKRYKQEIFLLEVEQTDMYSEPLYKLHSIDSSKYPLIVTGKEEFMHNNKFIATYKTKDDVMFAVNKLNEVYFTTETHK